MDVDIILYLGLASGAGWATTLDKDGWLEWCRNNLSSIKREYAKRIASYTSGQDFFGDLYIYKGYSDVGYYLGC